MTLPDTVKDLNPSTTKEWLMVLNNKLDDALESQADDRDSFIKYMERIDKWIECHDKDMLQREKELATKFEKIDSLEKKVNSWSMTNTIMAIGAAIAAMFGLKGS